MFEPFIFDIIDNLPISEGCALDIGAHQGTITRRLSKKFNHVYAFEPHPKNIEKLHSRGPLDSNITLIQKAISNTNSSVKLFLHDNPYMHTIHVDTAKTYENFDFIEVQSVIIDDFCSDKVVSFIKCDIEGAEDLIFEAAVNTLKTNKINIIIEFHKTTSINKMTLFLKQYGYEKRLVSKISKHILYSNINH